MFGCFWRKDSGEEAAELGFWREGQRGGRMRKLWERDIRGREFSFCRERRASIAIVEIFLGEERSRRVSEKELYI